MRKKNNKKTIIVIGLVILAIFLFSGNIKKQAGDCVEVIDLFGVTLPPDTQCVQLNEQTLQAGHANYVVYNEHIALLFLDADKAVGDDLYSLALSGQTNLIDDMVTLQVYFDSIPSYYSAYNSAHIKIYYKANMGGSCSTDGNDVEAIHAGHTRCYVHEIQHIFQTNIFGTMFAPLTACPGGFSGDLFHNIFDRIGDYNLVNKPYGPLGCDIPINSCGDVWAYTYTYSDQISLVSCVYDKLYAMSPKACTMHPQVCNMNYFAQYAWECGARTDKDAEMNAVCPYYGDGILCDNVADTDNDCSISLGEVITYANKWVNNQGVTLSEIIAVANIWVDSGSY